MATELVCTPNNLLDLSSCLKCIPVGSQREVMIALLARIAGIDPDPQNLMDLAKCMKIIPSGMQDEVISMLLCQISGGVTPIPDCTMLSGDGPPTGSATPSFTGQLYHDTTADTYYRSTGLTSADWVAIGGGGAQLYTTIPPGNEQLFGLMSSYGGGVDIPGLLGLIWNGTTTQAGFFVTGLTAIQSISCPNLVSIDPTGTDGTFDCSSCSALTTLSLPVLTTVGGQLLLYFCSSLTTLDLSALTTIGGQLKSNNCTALTTVDVSSWVPTDGTTIDFNVCALNATSVELILRRCVLAGVTTCTINLSGGTNAGLASLSAQGQADAATLGAQLTINP